MRDTGSGHLKLSLVFPLFLTGAAILAGRLYNIQVTHHDYFLEQARRQSETSAQLPPNRGTIFDRNGAPLAFSLKVPSVFADPGILAVPVRARGWLARVLGVSPETFRKFLAECPDAIDAVNDPTLRRLRRVADQLARYLRVPESTFAARLDAAAAERLCRAARRVAVALGVSADELRHKFARDTRFVWLQRSVDEAAARRVSELGLRGVCVRYEQERRTARGLRIGQWLGLTGAEGRGLEGLERTFDRRLRGTPGLARLERDGHGRRIADSAEPVIPPRHGSHLHLTIDARIQRIVGRELDRVGSEFSPVSVSAIVMEPGTGRILAMDSVPGLLVSERAEISRDELRLRLRNHPVQSVYEYGSTFKPFIAAAVLDLGLAVPDTRINCENGCWRYRHRTLHDHHPYGILPVSDIIVHSSNIGAAKLGLLLGPERLARVVELYHFGEEYGVRLPVEEPGIVTRRDRWTYYTTTSVPMGQEIAGTPLQLIAGFCSLINGGRLMEPFIVEAVENPNSGDVTRRTPIEVRRVIRPATSATMRRILAQVVERGTGRRLREARYPIGGKTGTAQKRAAAGGYSHDKFVASFIGFAPVDEPKLCVLVMADEPQGAHYGGTVAAPAVGRIIDSSLALLEAAPPSESGPVVAVRETDSR